MYRCVMYLRIECDNLILVKLVLQSEEAKIWSLASCMKTLTFSGPLEGILHSVTQIILFAAREGESIKKQQRTTLGPVLPSSLFINGKINPAVLVAENWTSCRSKGRRISSINCSRFCYKHTYFIYSTKYIHMNFYPLIWVSDLDAETDSVCHAVVDCKDTKRGGRKSCKEVIQIA